MRLVSGTLEAETGEAGGVMSDGEGGIGGSEPRDCNLLMVMTADRGTRELVHSFVDFAARTKTSLFIHLFI